jgi:hypothetical protein
MDSAQQRFAQFEEEFFPYIKQLSEEELSTFFGLVEWFVDRYCAGYQLEGPIYLVLDNSIVQDFKHRQDKKRWLRAQCYVALTRFIAIFSDRETCLCVSPVALYEHAGKVVPPTEAAGNALISELFGLLSPCRLPVATIGFNPSGDLIKVLEDVHHDAKFMSTFAEQIDDMDLQRDLRAPGGGIYLPIAIAEALIPDDMPLQYFHPWYVKYVFASRIEHKIAAQSKQHPDAQPILSGRLSSLLAELNELKRGVLKGIGDIDLLQICDIRRQYASRPGHVLLGQTLDRTLANVLNQRHCYIESRQIVGGSKDTERQVAAAMKLMSSNPFAEQDERANRIAPYAHSFLKNLYGMCRAALQHRRA